MKWTEKEVEILVKELKTGTKPWATARKFVKSKILARKKRGIFEKAKKLIKAGVLEKE